MDSQAKTGAERLVDRHMPNASPSERADAIARVEQLARTLARIAIRVVEAEIRDRESRGRGRQDTIAPSPSTLS